MLSKIIIILNLLQSNIDSVLSFRHYRYYDLKSIKNCPYQNKFINNIKNNNKLNIQEMHQKILETNKNVLIRYPVRKPQEKYYNPKNVDWSSVISGCHAACNFDKRLCNFYIRASAHDSLSISEGYGGSDGSVVITEDELNRPENNYDNFAYKLSKNALALAKRFDTSVADIIAVCGAYAVKYLGGIDIIKFSTKTDPFLVGRKDSTIPNPAHQLVPENANTSLFNTFSNKYGFTLEEFSALLGSHVLLDEKECLNKDNTYCDPTINSCKDISMYKWDNSYFHDICSKNISITFNTLPITFLKSKKQLIKNELCKYTSDYFKREVKVDIFNELGLDIDTIMMQDELTEKTDLIIEQDLQLIKPINVNYYVNNEPKHWLYTINDAWLGLACQKKLDNSSYNIQISESMNKFKNSERYWNLIYMKAYKKMINNNVRWFNLRQMGFRISGNECNSGYKIYNNITLCKTAFSPDDLFYE